VLPLHYRVIEIVHHSVAGREFVAASHIITLPAPPGTVNANRSARDRSAAWLPNNASRFRGQSPGRRGTIEHLELLPRSCVVSLSPVADDLRDRYLRDFLEVARRVQNGSDPEVILEALIDAARLLREYLQRELVELRQEQAD
jgi:hypothetical protein